MSHVFQVPDDIYTEIAAYAAQRGQTPDALLMALLTGGVELLKRVEATPSLHEVLYDPAHDPFAPFIGVFDGGEGDAGWTMSIKEYYESSPSLFVDTYNFSVLQRRKNTYANLHL